MSKLFPKENDVKKIVKARVDSWGAWSFAPIQRGMGEHGLPDRIACVPITITPKMVGMRLGLFVGIEVKKAGRRNEKNAGASTIQVQQMVGIADAHGVVALVDCEQDMDILEANIFKVLVDHGINVSASVLQQRIAG